MAEASQPHDVGNHACRLNLAQATGPDSGVLKNGIECARAFIRSFGRAPSTTQAHNRRATGGAHFFKPHHRNFMTTTKMRITEPVLRTFRTTDAARYPDDRIGVALADLETSLGLLDPGDLSSIKAILSKYGSRGARTTQTGISTPDAATRAAENRRRFDEQIAVNREASAARNAFWNGVRDANA